MNLIAKMSAVNLNATYMVNSNGHLAKVEEYDPDTMVLRTLTPDMQLTQEQIDMLDEAEKYPIVYEDDCPELTPEMIEAFRKAAAVRDAREYGLS